MEMDGIVVKNCKICLEYSKLATSAQESSLKFIFLKLRDEAIDRVLRRIKLGSIVLPKYGPFCNALETACLECNYSRPKILDEWQRIWSDNKPFIESHQFVDHQQKYHA